METALCSCKPSISPIPQPTQLTAEDVQHDRCLAERGRGAGVVPGVAKGRGRDGQAAHWGVRGMAIDRQHTAWPGADYATVVL